MPFRPRKKSYRKNKFGTCRRCGGRVRRHERRCKKCNQATS